MPWNQTSHWIMPNSFRSNGTLSTPARYARAKPAQHSPSVLAQLWRGLFDQFHQLFPVVDLFKGQVFHRRAGDDQPVRGPGPARPPS
ncbi:MAG: hypothetical protein CM15mP77_0510 [Synechococcus sp.]|nr:MAG: hypothetical protein CM15mP77_0510 [Synechococcus sp.]